MFVLLYVCVCLFCCSGAWFCATAAAPLIETQRYSILLRHAMTTVQPCLIPVSGKKTLLQRRRHVGNSLQKHQIRGWRAGSAAVLQGNSSRKRSAFFTDTGILSGAPPEGLPIIMIIIITITIITITIIVTTTYYYDYVAGAPNVCCPRSKDPRPAPSARWLHPCRSCGALFTLVSCVIVLMCVYIYIYMCFVVPAERVGSLK